MIGDAEARAKRESLWPLRQAACGAAGRRAIDFIRLAIVAGDRVAVDRRPQRAMFAA
jgi:hypothetical protein